MGAGEDRDIHGYACAVRFIQSDTEVSLATQEKQDEDANMHETQFG